MISDQRLAAGDGVQPLWLLVDKANRLLQAVATPSIVQLVMRLAVYTENLMSGGTMARIGLRMMPPVGIEIERAPL